MELQKKSAILRFYVGLGLCCVKLHHGMCFRDVFLLAIIRLLGKLFQDLLGLNNSIAQCHTKLTQFPAERVRLSEDGNKNAYVYACGHLCSAILC